ncbi:unnamed protein product, partial [Vitis vinifera]
MSVILENSNGSTSFKKSFFPLKIFGDSLIRCLLTNEQPISLEDISPSYVDSPPKIMVVEIYIFGISLMPSKISITSNSVTSPDASRLSVIRTTTGTSSIKILIPSSKLICAVIKQVKQVNLETSSRAVPIS